MILFGESTASITPAVRKRAILVLENADVSYDLQQNIAANPGPATLFETMTRNDALIAEMREWIDANHPKPSDAMIETFHAYAEVPSLPAGSGVFGKQVVVIIRHETTAVLFKTFFAGRE